LKGHDDIHRPKSANASHKPPGAPQLHPYFLFFFYLAKHKIVHELTL
jgi:hypothetical protein